MPTISIITPCYNSAKFVGSTIESVRAQTWADWEHVVVDDGSVDGSAEIVCAYADGDSRLRLVRKSNGGVASARNAGFRACAPDSRYLLFLDADDMLEPTMLEHIARYLDVHPDVGMAYCAPQFIDEQNRELDSGTVYTGWSPRYTSTRLGVRPLSAQEPETPFASILGLTTIIPSVAVMRRSVYERTTQWDEAFGHIFEDADLFLRLALISKVHFLPQRLVRYRRHDSQSTASGGRYHAQEQKLLAKWRAPQGLTPEQAREVQAAWRFREGRLLPALGLIAGTQHLQRGEWKQAARFYGGAVRRYAASFLTGSARHSDGAGAGCDSASVTRR